MTIEDTFKPPVEWDYFHCHILALDLGGKLGWAYRPAPGKRIISGNTEFKVTRYEGGGIQWVRFRFWLGEILKKAAIKHVVYEKVSAHKGTNASHAYGGFLGHMSEMCEQFDLPYHGISVQDIKESATGKRNASKDEVIAAINNRGFKVTDDNEADAIAMLLCVESQQQW